MILIKLTPNHFAQKRTVLTGALHASLFHLLRLLHEEHTSLFKQTKDASVSEVSIIVDIKVSTVKKEHRFLPSAPK